MNIDQILDAFRRCHVACILIGGVNFMLRHEPVLTFDVDLWIEDAPENCDRCEKALAALDAQWGESEGDWGPVASKPPGWLRRQGIFCLASPVGAIDVFRSVAGLDSWADCRARAQVLRTSGQIEYVSLSDADMLRCQLALPAANAGLCREAEYQPEAPARAAPSQRPSLALRAGIVPGRPDFSTKPGPVDDDLKRREERKRELCWDPAERWRALQATITWAEAQAAVPRNTPQRCLELQRAKLAAKEM